MRTGALFIASFIILNSCLAQQSDGTKMNNIEYQHNAPPSFESKLIQTAMGLFGIRKKMREKMIHNGFVKEPAKIPKSILCNFRVQEMEQNNRKVFTITAKDSASDIIILYLHGGAYMGNITKQHWDFIGQLISKTNATIIIPDYPLAPQATYRETYEFIEVLYARILADYPTKRIVFIGDSAGGGLALGFIQQLRNESKKQPEQAIVLSPWLDITMSNPDIESADNKDKLLSMEGLKNAGLKYAGRSDLKDFRLSPIYGNLAGLCRISIFTGTNDLLNADAGKLKQLAREQSISFNYFEYPDMFHDWVIITSLKESRDVISKVGSLVNDYK